MQIACSVQMIRIVPAVRSMVRFILVLMNLHEAL